MSSREPPAMMGVSHAVSGAAAGLLITTVAAPSVGVASPRDAFVFAAVAAGYALLPDLDHPSSTATRRFSWASVLACYLIRPLSAVVFRMTATSRDSGRGTHRGLTHTAVFAAGLGVGANAAVARWGTPALWLLLFIGVALAIKGLDALVPGPPSLVIAAGATWAITGTVPWHQTAPGADLHTPWLGTAIAVGMLVHSCGDALTSSGAPLLAPVPIRRRTWYPVRLPRPLRFRTGGPVEGFILVSLTVAVVGLALHTVPELWALTVRASARVVELAAR
ncbi:metal-dependent hydrolase [Pseudonocardia spinosispora]|uniref:metal-dependent hydrolase n=1 Tax=Pseudonocardia spinosispora TaxID=103441 RepID=UPI000A00B676|nr:metal-dependent hydrolase [Pseudonocardia spinosispora]